MASKHSARPAVLHALTRAVAVTPRHCTSCYADADNQQGHGAGSAAHRVQQLLASIPQDLLAQAAAQCGAHARALLHYEAHLRSKGVALNPVALKNVYASDMEVSFLQVSLVFSQHGWHAYSLAGVCGKPQKVCTEPCGPRECPCLDRRVFVWQVLHVYPV